MNTINWMLGGLMAIWLAGSILNSIIPDSTAKHRNALYLIAPILGLYFTINTLWLVNTLGVAHTGFLWFTLGQKDITITVDLSSTTLALLLVVSCITLLVHIYAIGYMRNDTARPRFFGTLGLFTFSMIGLTLSDNLLVMFMFWELVGICSYLLIGFYRNKPEAGRASTKALLINKIGDVGFLLGIGSLWALTGTFSISELSTIDTLPYSATIGFFFLIAAFAKSAQFPFHTWLPDAMAGPTPVSALIHSATMVAAGVFLLVRMHFIFTVDVLQVASLVGALTALLGGINAIRENDLKRFLAWSTLSQLGLMIMTLGTGAFNPAFVHLLSHAIFKSGLFLLAGIMIQHYHIKSFTMPFQSSGLLRGVIYILTFSLIGMPLTIGYFSKEALLWGVSDSTMIFAFYINSFLTAFYSARLLIFARRNNQKTTKPVIPLTQVITVITLSICSLWFLYDWSPLAMPAILSAWSIESPGASLAFTNIGIAFFGMAASVGFHRQQKFESIQRLIPALPYDAWLRASIVKPVLALANFTTHCDRQLDRCLHFTVYVNVFTAKLMAWFDRYIIDGCVHFFVWVTRAVGNALRQLVTGRIQDYIWWTVVALIILLLILAN